MFVSPISASLLYMNPGLSWNNLVMTRTAWQNNARLLNSRARNKDQVDYSSWLSVFFPLCHCIDWGCIWPNCWDWSSGQKPTGKELKRFSTHETNENDNMTILITYNSPQYSHLAFVWLPIFPWSPEFDNVPHRSPRKILQTVCNQIAIRDAQQSVSKHWRKHRRQRWWG